MGWSGEKLFHLFPALSGTGGLGVGAAVSPWCFVSTAPSRSLLCSGVGSLLEGANLPELVLRGFLHRQWLFDLHKNSIISKLQKSGLLAPSRIALYIDIWWLEFP